MATVGEQLTKPEVGWTRYENDHPAFTYTGGWNSTNASDNDYSNGTKAQTIYENSSANGAKVKFDFVGTQLRFIGASWWSCSDTIDIYIDGSLIETISQNLGRDIAQILNFEITNLENKKHSVEIINRTINYLIVDAIEINSDGYLILPIGAKLSAPEVGWKRYDDSLVTLKYTGNFGVLSDANFFNGSYHYINEGEVSFSFIGTMIRVIGAAYDNKSKDIKIIIDGIEETFSQYSQNAVVDSLNYEKRDLDNTLHNVKIVEYGENDMIIDAIDINADGRLLHPDEVTDIKDLEVGKRIRCHYTAFTQNTVGTFSNLGEETYKDGINDFLPATPTATPNGDFYFIMVEDWNGKKRLIADRNIQNYISWDSINKNGFVFGKNLGKEKGAATTLNKSLVFNGNDATLKFPNILSGKTDFSFSVDIRTNQSVSHSRTYNDPSIFGIKQGSGITGDLNVVIRTGMVGLYEEISGGTTFNSTNKNIADNDWHNVAFVRNGTNVSIYIDGEKLLSKTMPATPLKDSEILAGSCYWDSGSKSYVGEMKNYLIYDSALDEDEVQKISDGKEVINANLVGCYKLDSLEIEDLSGKGNDGSYSGVVTLGIDDSRVSTRLMTGGTTGVSTGAAIDKDNEWDKYIVNSDLDKTIAPGDNNVWHWNGNFGSWTSTTPSTSSTNRIKRGSNVGSSAWYSDTASSAVNQYSCYRPVLEIEELFSIHSFVFMGGQYKKYTDTWVVFSNSMPSSEQFETDGIDDLSVLSTKLSTSITEAEKKQFLDTGYIHHFTLNEKDNAGLTHLKISNTQ